MRSTDIVEAVDYPHIGERVIYTPGDGSPRHIAFVKRLAVHDGDVDLVATSDPDDWDIIASDVKPGNGAWTYERIDP